MEKLEIGLGDLLLGIPIVEIQAQADNKFVVWSQRPGETERQGIEIQKKEES